MKINKFEEIQAWNKAQDFSVNIYKSFSGNKDWDFRNQICRASVSISNNIAEGFDRNSNKEFVRFLFISLASNSEVSSMLYLANQLNYLTKEQMNILLLQSNEISKRLSGLIKYLAAKTKSTKPTI